MARKMRTGTIAMKVFKDRVKNDTAMRSSITMATGIQIFRFSLAFMISLNMVTCSVDYAGEPGVIKGFLCESSLTNLALYQVL